MIRAKTTATLWKRHDGGSDFAFQISREATNEIALGMGLTPSKQRGSTMARYAIAPLTSCCEASHEWPTRRTKPSLPFRHEA